MSEKHYTGLTDAQVLESRQKHGANIFVAPEEESVLKKFLERFANPIIRILLVALFMSFCISIYEFLQDGEASVFFEPSGILVAILLATVVGFILDQKNEKTFKSLNSVNDDTLVKVIRNDNVCQVPRKDVVVGDIVLLDTGEEVPADCQLLSALNLVMNESSLTGELQCAKTVNQDEFDPNATYPSDHIMKGTMVIEGYCTAKVIAVGSNTEGGKVFEAAQVKDAGETPLNQKLTRLAAFISKAGYVIAALIIVGRLLMYFFNNADAQEFQWLAFLEYLLNTVMIAVTLIVVAVPEGLPMSITMSLALSMKKLMKENTLPRTMHSCETMGATSVICTDKTGTLTQNQMRVYEPNFEGLDGLDGQVLKDDVVSRRIIECISVNSTANLDFSVKGKIAAIGNPTEGALLLWLHAQDVNYLKVREKVELIDRIPFTTELKYMVSVVRSEDGKKVLYVKGAPEIVLGYTSADEAKRESVKAKLLEYQSKAMRTLGFAYKELAEDEVFEENGKLVLKDLTFMGIVAISDPVREDVPAAIKACIDAGIQVKIVTGDTPGTAKEIGRQVGLWTDEDTDYNIIAGTEFAQMSEAEAKSRIFDMKIMSRARPNDKERLVRLLRGQGMVVAVTGDGTNDAPALNAADVGLSMGDGTSVAKEASDMTIMDSSFTTITHAVMWGRSLYKNIQRFIMFQMTINVVACLIVLLGAFTGTESPLTVTQMLWVNIIMDTLAALALASLPPSETVMKDAPRKMSDSIISKSMAANIIVTGGLFTAVLLALYVFMLKTDLTSILEFVTTLGQGGYVPSHVHHLSPYELGVFFTAFVFLQFWNMFNAKLFMTDSIFVEQLRGSMAFFAVAGVILVGQYVIVRFAYMLFDIDWMRLKDMLAILGVTSAVFIIGEIYRLVAFGYRKLTSK